jgi:hypothetical protein
VTSRPGCGQEHLRSRTTVQNDLSPCCYLGLDSATVAAYRLPTLPPWRQCWQKLARVRSRLSARLRPRRPLAPSCGWRVYGPGYGGREPPDPPSPAKHQGGVQYVFAVQSRCCRQNDGPGDDAADAVCRVGPQPLFHDDDSFLVRVAHRDAGAQSSLLTRSPSQRRPDVRCPRLAGKTDITMIGMCYRFCQAGRSGW